MRGRIREVVIYFKFHEYRPRGLGAERGRKSPSPIDKAHGLYNQSINNQTNYFIVRLKVDQRAGQLSLPHLGITKTERIELKHKTDEQISPVNSL